MDPLQLVQCLPRLRRYARMLTGDRNRADDLVQDTMERAWSRQSQWRANTDLRAWLFTIMHNVYVSELRRPVAQMEVALDMDASQLLHDGAPGPEACAALALDLQQALLALPEEQRAVLLLVTLEDLRYEEAAAVLGIPAGTVMSRLSRARSRLRELWQPADGRSTVRAAPQARLKVVK
jgi:RNA polymerase sigma-70 factor (ECF subfamily)